MPKGEKNLEYIYFLYLLKGMPEESSLSMKPDDSKAGNFFRCFISLYCDQCIIDL